MRISILLLAIAGCCAIVLMAIGRRGEIRMRQVQAMVRQAAQSEDDDHLMTPAFYRRLHRIQSGVYESGAISDSNLDWVLNLIAHPARKDNGYLAQANTMIALSRLKEPPPSQKEKIRRVLIPLLTTDQPNDEGGLDKLYAARLILITHDTAAIPYVETLLQDRRANVRERGQSILQRLRASVVR